MNNFDSNFGIGQDLVAWMQIYWPVLVLLVLWSLFWKGLALWHAAKQNHSWWFMALLVVNTLGLLEMGYLFFVLKLKPQQLFL